MHLKEKIRAPSLSPAPVRNEEQLLGVAGAVLDQGDCRDELNERSLFHDFCTNIGFALNYLRSSDREREAFARISKSIGILSVLNDEIRNPLTIIAGFFELEGGSYTDRIIKQVNRIDSVINRLDGGFLESVKIYEFLRKHYGREKGDFDSCR
jgi:hypothetical protein